MAENKNGNYLPFFQQKPSDSGGATDSDEEEDKSVPAASFYEPSPAELRHQRQGMSNSSNASF